MKNYIKKIQFTAEENLRFNQLLDKQERKHLMSIYRFMLKKTIDKIILFNDNTLKASLRALRKAYIEECHSSYRCKETKFYELMSTLEELQLIRVTKARTKFGANTYEFCRYFSNLKLEERAEEVASAEETILIENEQEIQIVTAGVQVSEVNGYEDSHLENLNLKLSYNTLYDETKFESEKEVLEIAENLLKDYKLSADDRVSVFTHIKTKIKKYWKRINISGAKEYITRMLIEVIALTKKINKSVKAPKSTVKKVKKQLRFSNYNQRPEKYDEDEFLGWDDLEPLEVIEARNKANLEQYKLQDA
ncbi:hypothetical protein [Clostridium massiliamazoniense]|uniref:hypothetical protein n=1 Tax=Clostridium massiliamazoniense TaxID=1347366 RepID=UPI0006D7D4FB|nr:hypothetical protein [Clostridium massiliamazoniense]